VKPWLSRSSGTAGQLTTPPESVPPFWAETKLKQAGTVSQSWIFTAGSVQARKA
jgi:hypothetical protein